MNLPEELIEFLQTGAQLDYDYDLYEPAGVKLLPLEQLKLQNFPVCYAEGLIDSHENPHAGESGCYMVQAVNLVASCHDFDPVGILVWLPLEKRFGAWDDDHLHMEVFDEQVNWKSIVANPGPHVEASCGGEGYDPPFSRLKCWLQHPFVSNPPSEPQDIE